MPIVYIAVNQINGHSYVGITSRGLAKRRYEHLARAKSGKENFPLHLAILKYGPDAFSFGVLEECATMEDANGREVALIAELKPEYNCTLGGLGNLGRYWSPEARRKVGDTKRGNNYRTGQTHTDGVREVLRMHGKRNAEQSRRNLEVAHAAWRRKVVCLYDDKEHVSATAAAGYYGVPRSAVIELCLGQRGRKSIRGLSFRYVEAR